MKKIFSVPNILSFSRMLLVFPVSYALWKNALAWATFLLVVAGITDLLDGFLARHYGWRTTLGSWIDPMADKILIATVLFTQTAKGEVPGWFCGITVFRDAGLAVGTLGLLAMGIKIKINPYLSGKLATVAQNVALLVSIFQQIFPVFGRTLPTLLVISAVLTVISSIWYMKGFSLILRQTPQSAMSRTAQR